MENSRIGKLDLTIDELMVATDLYDFENTRVQRFVQECGCSGELDIIQNVKLLHDGVRDLISYNVFHVYLSEGLSASRIVEDGVGFCLHKSVLFVAGCRLLGLPAVLCSDVVVNHISDESMLKLVGGSKFLHWYARVRINSKWVKAAPIFNQLLCNLYGIEVVEFDVEDDSIQQQDQNGNLMEYSHQEKIYLNPNMQSILSEIARFHPLMVNGKGMTPSTVELKNL